MKRDRRGFALLVAMWMILAIAVVAVQFEYDARERRALGLAASESGQGRAAALGALNLLQAELEYALIQGPTTASTSLSSTTRGDPWLGVDSIYSGPVQIDSVPVEVQLTDLGTQLNINNMNQQQLQTFFGLIMNDPSAAQKVAGAVLDWVDPDTITRTNGAEAGQYIADNKLTLPTNAPFREIDQLLDVEGMTQDIYDKAVPYLTTHGSGIINVNAADTVVLKSLPGMSTQILTSLLAQRANGRRITNIASAFPSQGGNGAAGRGVAAPRTANTQAGRAGGRGTTAAPAAAGGQAGQQLTPQEQQLVAATTTTTTEVELNILARLSLDGPPTRLQAILTKGTGNTSTISWKQW